MPRITTYAEFCDLLTAMFEDYAMRFRDASDDDATYYTMETVGSFGFTGSWDAHSGYTLISKITGRVYRASNYEDLESQFDAQDQA